MKKYLVLAALSICSVQAEEKFINHTGMKLQIQTEYSFCSVDAVEIPAQKLINMKTGTILNSKDTNAIKDAAKTASLAIVPGQTSSHSGKECCLSYMKIVTGGGIGWSSDPTGGYFVRNLGGTADKPTHEKFLYDDHFAGCKDRTFNIYEDSSKPNGIRVE